MKKILLNLYQLFFFFQRWKGKNTTKDLPHAIFLKQCNYFWKITESYAMVCVRRELQNHLVQPPSHGQGHVSLDQVT